MRECNPFCREESMSKYLSLCYILATKKDCKIETNQQKEYDCTCVELKRLLQPLMLHHDVHTNQLRECLVLINPEHSLQNAQVHSLQGQKVLLQQVLSILYPEKITNDT